MAYADAVASAVWAAIEAGSESPERIANAYMWASWTAIYLYWNWGILEVAVGDGLAVCAGELSVESVASDAVRDLADPSA